MWVLFGEDTRGPHRENVSSVQLLLLSQDGSRTGGGSEPCRARGRRLDRPTRACEAGPRPAAPCRRRCRAEAVSKGPGRRATSARGPAGSWEAQCTGARGRPSSRRRPRAGPLRRGVEGRGLGPSGRARRSTLLWALGCGRAGRVAGSGPHAPRRGRRRDAPRTSPGKPSVGGGGIGGGARAPPYWTPTERLGRRRVLQTSESVGAPLHAPTPRAASQPPSPPRARDPNPPEPNPLPSRAPARPAARDLPHPHVPTHAPDLRLRTGRPSGPQGAGAPEPPWSALLRPTPQSLCCFGEELLPGAPVHSTASRPSIPRARKRVPSAQGPERVRGRDVSRALSVTKYTSLFVLFKGRVT